MVRAVAPALAGHDFILTAERKNIKMVTSTPVPQPKENLVVGSKVKEVIRNAGLRSDGELVQAVSEKVHEMLQAAVERCKANNRSTVRKHDL